jgi:single-strand DNA-binding protein
MINDAHVVFSGYVATDPTFKKLSDGTSNAKLRVAYTPRRRSRATGEWGDGPTTFVTVECWRALADNVAVCLRKGEPVIVRGRLQVRPYESPPGTPRFSVEVDASAIGHDLNRGVAHFSRLHRGTAVTAAPGNGALPGGSPGDGALSDGRPGDGELGDGGAADGALGDGRPGDGDDVIDARAVEELTRELGEGPELDPGGR